MITEEKVEVDIVLPFRSPSECVCLHSSEREQVRDLDIMLEIYGGFYRKRKIEERELNAISYPRHIIIFIYVDRIQLDI